jgi:aryl-alcohol dehydrogenase-like predicted oxidoreductase
MSLWETGDGGTEVVVIEPIFRGAPQMITRRQWLGLTAGAGAALTLNPTLLRALVTGPKVLTRAIPSTGEAIPLVGLGSSATFAQVARSEDYSALREVLSTMVDKGGTVFDTAPAYGVSEQVAGDIAAELGITERVFWATKVNVAQQGGTADPARARQQIETSFNRLRKRPIDLIQVHSLGDVPTQLGILKDLKGEGRVRYIGVTSTSKGQYADVERIMRNEPIDFIGIDYAVDNRDVEERILPLAQDRGIAVMVYMPFGRTRLWNRIGDRPLPDWAQEFDADSWAQFMIKYVASHPAVTVVTPATSQARHMADNMGAAVGRLPDEAMRRRMAQYADALPAAQPPQPPAPTHAVLLPAAVLERYVGAYQLASGTTINVRRAGAGLAAQPAGMQEFALSTLSETRFSIPNGPVLEFQLDDEGAVTGLIVEQGGQRMPATRVR